MTLFKSRHLLIGLLAPVLLTGACIVVEHRPEPYEPRAVIEAGVLPWAPEHGYLHKVVYRYYPDQEIYYNVNRGMWCWSDRGHWRVEAQLPITFRSRLGPFVKVDVEGDEPWRYHPKIRGVYPPGRHDKPLPPDRRREHGR